MDQVMSSQEDKSVGLIKWSIERNKFDLTDQDGKVIVSSKDKGYLNYLVVKQKHTAIIEAGIKSTKLVVEESSNLGIPQDLLDGIKAEMEPFVKAGVCPEFTRPRGRPRKHIPTVDNCRRHVLGDEENSDQRILLPITKHKIILDFKEYMEENWVPKKAIEQICSLYSVPYKQAYSICQEYI